MSVGRKCVFIFEMVRTGEPYAMVTSCTTRGKTNKNDNNNNSSGIDGAHRISGKRQRQCGNKNVRNNLLTCVQLSFFVFVRPLLHMCVSVCERLHATVTPRRSR